MRLMNALPQTPEIEDIARRAVAERAAPRVKPGGGLPIPQTLAHRRAEGSGTLP
jgi:hypothetical protein